MRCPLQRVEIGSCVDGRLSRHAQVDQLTEQVKQRDALLSAEGSKLGVTGLGLHDGRLSDDQVQHGLRSLSALVSNLQRPLARPF